MLAHAASRRAASACYNAALPGQAWIARTNCACAHACDAGGAWRHQCSSHECTLPSQPSCICSGAAELLPLLYDTERFPLQDVSLVCGLLHGLVPASLNMACGSSWARQYLFKGALHCRGLGSAWREVLRKCARKPCN